MSWNYRVLKNEDVYAIHEVYYDENLDIVNITEKPVRIVADDLEELKSTLDLISSCLNKPVIDYNTGEEES